MNRGRLKILLQALIVGALVIAAYRFVDLDALGAALAEFHYSVIPLLLGMAAGHLLLKSWQFVMLLRPLVPEIDEEMETAVSLTYVAGQAAVLLPGGIAARAVLLKDLGVPVSQSTVPIILLSLLTHVLFFITAILAGLWYEAFREPVLIILGVTLVSALVFLIPATRRLLQRVATWVSEKVGVGDTWQAFLDNVPLVVRERRVRIAAITLSGLALLIKVLMLDFTARGLGIIIPYRTLLIAYALSTQLGTLSGLPAGLGVTEASLVSFLVALSGHEVEMITAVTLIFRVVSVLLPAALGAVAYLYFRARLVRPAAQEKGADEAAIT